MALVVLGCGWIARRHARAARRLRLPVIFASRDLARARAYAREFGGVGAYGDYETALRDPRARAAVVCTPQAPDCPRCPLKAECLARREGIQERLPRKPDRPATVAVREVCVVVRHGGRVLLARRPAGGRWANMWEFPRTVLEPGQTHDAAARQLIASLGLRAEPGPEVMTLRYGVTRFRMTMVCLEAAARTKAFRSAYYDEGRWLKPADLAAFPVSSAQRRLAAALQRPRPRGLF